MVETETAEASYDFQIDSTALGHKPQKYLAVVVPVAENAALMDIIP